MPNYKNIKPFIQIIPLNGKRYAVKPNETIYLEKEIDTKIYDFLIKEDDNKSASKPLEIKSKKVASTNSVNKLENTLETVKKDLQTLTSQPDKNEVIIKRLDIMKDAIIKTQERMDEMTKTITELQESNNELVEVVNKIQYEIIENGGFVIEDAEENDE